jgi:hypothetical protein
LSEEELAPFFWREFLVSRVKRGFESEVRARLIDELRLSGELVSCATRAAEKRGLLQGVTTAGPGLEETGLSAEDLWRWYFVDHLGVPVPRDLCAYARERGTDASTLARAVIREYLYRERCRRRSEPSARSSVTEGD